MFLLKRSSVIIVMNLNFCQIEFRMSARTPTNVEEQNAEIFMDRTSKFIHNKLSNVKMKNIDKTNLCYC